MAIEFDKRFFESTRGRIVISLRNSVKTVNELAAEFGLTDNAVRAHLLTLERDRLVEQNGSAKGHRKPHFLYTLTTEAHKRFPKAYDSLINRLLDVLRRTLRPAQYTGLLEEAGRDIGHDASANAGDSIESKIVQAVSVLGELGGAADIVTEDSKTTIQSNYCPFAAVVSEHPETCRLAEAMIEEIVGLPVNEHCDRTTPAPRCRFEIRTNEAAG
jgi:predicted ArsR family transcriptional regulator